MSDCEHDYRKSEQRYKNELKGLNLVGKPIEEAKQLVQSLNYTYRVAAEDGKFNVLTMDLDISRVNFIVNSGIVTNWYTG